MDNSTFTDFDEVINRFYDRIEKDDKFFSYCNVSAIEARQIAEKRAVNYLIEALDYMTSLDMMQVNFADYDTEIRHINFILVPKEIRILVELMFLFYMKRDEPLLHAMEINFIPSDLQVFSPANERSSYRLYIKQLTYEIELMIDDYKNHDRITNQMKQVITYGGDNL